MSILDGVSLQALQARLTAMQTAWLELSSGQKIEVGSYAQVTGSRTVTYTKANIADLTAAILGVQKAIDALSGGGTVSRRRPIVPYFQ